MKRYDSYKDSGIEWIGEVPNHWEVCRLKNHSHIVLGKMLMSSPPKGEEHLYTLEKYLKAKNIGWLHITDDEDYIEEMWFNKYEKSIYRLQENDLVMNEGGDVGKIGIWRNHIYSCYIQNSINKITIDNTCNPFYFQYLLFAIAKTNYFWSIVNPISIAHLTKEKLACTPIVCPPLSEQQAIASYLDKRCGEIDKAIAKQQKRIELLQELRQSIITNAVTRGINPDAPLKDSGVEWIGQVPEHWEVMMLKRCATIKTGCTPPTKELKYYENEDIDWFTPGDIGDDNVSEAEKKISNIAKKDGVCRIFPSHIVYFVGIGATIGKVSYCDIEASANQQINAIIPNHRGDYRFLTYCLKSQKEEIFLTANTVTLPIINQERTGSLLIPVPPLSEQLQIVDRIEKQIVRFDKAIAKAEHRIGLLQELKQSIITEVVIGKRKVC